MKPVNVPYYLAQCLKHSSRRLIEICLITRYIDKDTPLTLLLGENVWVNFSFLPCLFASSFRVADENTSRPVVSLGDSPTKLWISQGAPDTEMVSIFLKHKKLCL